MRIGNRIFPYPTLNNDDSLTEYKNSSFELCFDSEENHVNESSDTGLYLKNVHFVLHDHYLELLYLRKQLKCTLIVESATASYRITKEITNEPGYSLFIKRNDIADRVFVSAYLWASENIDKFKSDNFKDEYKDYTFEIDKYDIVAVDDGYSFKVEYDETENRLIHSIFTIVQRDGDDELMKFIPNKENIVITLTEKFFNSYESIKDQPSTYNIMFAMLAIPALTGALHTIKREEDNNIAISEVIEKYNWFKSVCNKYFEETGRELNEEEFINTEPFEIAQTVLKYGTTNGLNDYSEFLLHGKAREEETDE